MAVATKKVKTVKVMKEVLDIQTESVTLTLTPKEAQVLMLVCANVGGCSHDSFRKYTDNILYALREAAVPEIVNNGQGIFEQPLYFYFVSDREHLLK